MTAYVSEFDVPAGPLSLDADTVSLWRFDEPDGQNVEDAAGAFAERGAGRTGSSSPIPFASAATASRRSPARPRRREGTSFVFGQPTAYG